MPSFNRVMLAGNLTRDPELRPVGTTHVCAIGVATSRRFKDQEETTFVDCEAWGDLGEEIMNKLRKGDPIMLDGRLQLDQWKDKDGQNRSKLLVRVENVQFIGEDDQPSIAPGQSLRGEGYPPIEPNDIPF